MHESDLHELRHRLDCLEREHRRWKCVGVAAVALLGLIVLMGASTRTGRSAVGDVLAQSFILVGLTPTPRASLTMSNNDGPSLLLFDQQGKVRAGLTVLADGRPSLGLLDAQGQSRAVLALEPNGTPSLRFLDESGQVFWSAP
jgi:hypothetical protein